jgi:hypothetical protein
VNFGTVGPENADTSVMLIVPMRRFLVICRTGAVLENAPHIHKRSGPRAVLRPQGSSLMREMTSCTHRF